MKRGCLPLHPRRIARSAWCRRAAFLALALELPGSAGAESPAPRSEEAVAHAPRLLRGPRLGLEDGPLAQILHAAQREATGAEVSLCPPLPPGIRLGPGPVTAPDLLALVPEDRRLGVVELTGAQLKEILEHSARRLATYRHEEGLSLEEPGFDLSGFLTAGGVSYEIDLARPPGDRVIHLAQEGRIVEPARKLRVAVDERLLRSDPGVRDAPLLAPPGPWLREAVLGATRRLGTLGDAFEPGWRILPDYATSPERALVDRLVRLGAAPALEVHRLHPDEPARRGDLAYWLARAFGWRAARLSGAFPDVPDSLEPWLDGLLARRILGPLGTAEFFRPFEIVPVTQVLDWCEEAARRQGYALSAGFDRSFRRGLLAGTALGPMGGRVLPDTLTRSQLLGIVANARFPAVRVLGTGGLRGALRPRVDASGSRSGGAAVLAAHIARLRDENPEGTVLLDGGDMLQGAMISNLAHGRPVVELMNALGYAGATIGSHDFGWSVDTLARRVGEMRFAALGANLVERETGRSPRWTRPDTMIARRGVRVGVLGLCHPATPRATPGGRVAGLGFEDDSATAARRVPALRRAGAAAVIVVVHRAAGLDTAGRVVGDLARLARGVPGADLWLGGQSPPSVAGDVGGVPILVPAPRGEQIALLDLVVDPVGDRVVERRFRLVAVDSAGVTPDSAVAALVERWQLRVEAQASIPVGRSARPIATSDSAESAVASLVADAMRQAAATEIALQNSAGVRADLPAGGLTRGVIHEVLPFETWIVTMDLTGAEVRQAIEDGLRHQRVTQVSGIRYRYDPERQAGGRVVALETLDGSPLEETRTYRVACSDFLAGGGDDYGTLTRGRNRTNTGIGLREAFEGFLRRRSEGGALDYSGDGRVARAADARSPGRD